jgi:hypothetical protein
MLARNVVFTSRRAKAVDPMPLQPTAVAALADTRDRLRERHLRPAAERPETYGRGIHHTALFSSDVGRTIDSSMSATAMPSRSSTCPV